MGNRAAAATGGDRRCLSAAMEGRGVELTAPERRLRWILRASRVHLQRRDARLPAAGAGRALARLGPASVRRQLGAQGGADRRCLLHRRRGPAAVRAARLAGRHRARALGARPGPDPLPRRAPAGRGARSGSTISMTAILWIGVVFEGALAVVFALLHRAAFRSWHRIAYLSSGQFRTVIALAEGFYWSSSSKEDAPADLTPEKVAENADDYLGGLRGEAQVGDGGGADRDQPLPAALRQPVVHPDGRSTSGAPSSSTTSATTWPAGGSAASAAGWSRG